MRESNLLIINIIKSMITDRIGRHDVLLPIDQNNEKISEANYLWLIRFHKKNFTRRNVWQRSAHMRHTVQLHKHDVYSVLIVLKTVLW